MQSCFRLPLLGYSCLPKSALLGPRRPCFVGYGLGFRLSFDFTRLASKWVAGCAGHDRAGELGWRARWLAVRVQNLPSLRYLASNCLWDWACGLGWLAGWVNGLDGWMCSWDTRGSPRRPSCSQTPMFFGLWAWFSVGFCFSLLLSLSFFFFFRLPLCWQAGLAGTGTKYLYICRIYGLILNV